MTDDESRIESIFFRAVEAESRPEREEYLAEACGGDQRLRRRIEKLLNARPKLGAFMQAGAGDLTSTLDITAIEGPGDVIGGYKLLQEIGEGGFGVVYMAEQEQPVHRKVALKIVKPGMDTREVIARFEAERQALAMMDHPNIAHVLDAGATAHTDRGYPGRPYFVMELVKGVPITQYADKNNLSTQERLELFVTVCRAVQHAHQKGVIHRDIKPSNILVTLHDGQPVAKVIDFGIAKALNQKLTEKTLFTAYGQMIGTPQYMSPEQAEMSGLDVDTRSDIYSLGVLLYELLTGTPPLESKRLREAGYAEMQRMIQEEEPPRPSTRLSTLGDELTVVARHRSTDSKQLRKAIHGELDWIVMKSLEKERARRYESASSFAADLQRYLNNEAVQACPPSKLYGMKKLVSRHRGLFSATAAVVISLLIGLAFATYAFLRAEQESGRSRQIAEVLTEMLESADPSRGNGADYTVREMLDEIAGTLDGRFDDPIVESTLRHRIGRAYFHLGLPNVAEPHLRRALELRNGQSLSQLDEASILTDLAQTLMFTGGSQYNFAEPERAIRKAIEIYREEGDAKPELANSLCILGWVLYFKTNWWHFAGRENEGEMANREGIELLANYTDKRSLTVKGKMCVGLAFELLRGEPNDLNEAAAFAAKAVDLLRSHNPHDHFMCLAWVVNGLCQLKLEDLEGAEASFRQAKAVEERTNGAVAHDRLTPLISVLFQQEKFTEALDVARSRSVPDSGPMPPKFVACEIAVGRFLLGLGDAELAEAQLVRARETSLKHFGQKHSATLEATFFLAKALAAQDGVEKQAEAQKMFSALLQNARSQSDSDTAEPLSYGYVGIVGHLDSPTEDDFRRAQDVTRLVLAQPLEPVRRLRNLYVGALVKYHAGRFGEAMDFLREVIESPDAYRWDPVHAGYPFFTLRGAEDLLARVHVEAGRTPAAERVFRDAIARRKSAEPVDKYQVIYAKERLARFLLEQGRNGEARELLLSTQEDLADAPACFDWLKEKIQQDLARLSEA